MSQVLKCIPSKMGAFKSGGHKSVIEVMRKKIKSEEPATKHQIYEDREG